MSPHPRGAALPVDAAIAVATAALGLLIVSVEGRRGALDVSVHIAQSAQIVASLTLIARRRYPAVVLAICLALSFVSPAPAAVVALHATGRYVANRTVSFGCVLGTVLLAGPIWAVSPQIGGVAELLLYATLALAPWLVGQGERSAVELAAHRAEAAHRELQKLTDDARQSERLRLAREMHDVVAHRISLVVLQTNLLDAETSDPAVHEAADRIRTTSREALDELRGILGLLRRTDLAASADPSPELERHTLSDVEALATEAREVGQPVVVDLALTPRDVPDQAERTAFRVVREALTNAVRHAPGAPTSVRIDGDHNLVHVVVANDRPTRAPTGLTSGGTGLLGLRERVGLVGGTITAGPTPDGGFRVEAAIPRGRSDPRVGGG